jgi:hypothetical protein
MNALNSSGEFALTSRRECALIGWRLSFDFLIDF